MGESSSGPTECLSINSPAQPDPKVAENVGDMSAETASAVINLVAKLIVKRLNFSIQVAVDGQFLQFSSSSATKNSPTWAEVVAEGSSEAYVRPTMGPTVASKKYRPPSYRRRQSRRQAERRRNRLAEADNAEREAEGGAPPLHLVHLTKITQLFLNHSVKQ